MNDPSIPKSGKAAETSEQTTIDPPAVQGRSEIIPPVLDSMLRSAGIDPGDPRISKALEVSLTMMVGGTLPMPPPPIMQEYKEIKPELVETIVEWTEKQASHRRGLEKTRSDRSEDRLDRGQWIAAAVALGGLILATLQGIFGNPYVAGLTAIVSIGGPTAAIWLARNMRGQSSAAPNKPGPPKEP